MDESVGKIQLDLVTNQKQFDKQMSGIQSTAKKVGKTLAAAFAVKEIVNFGKECIDLGSDLAEVQNVVDVTFPKMKEQVNNFAKNAAASFGLSETMAKKFTGTFGAMAKSFGFSEKAAYDMSAQLTGLAGDVASFYNISQDEAFTKLKSVFSGETETLKDLGVVMTQSALDAYAMANGYGKVTSKMSEYEKVALRCDFVTQKLSLAAGDFSRTSDGWANQTRLLSLQFDSLKASIGQGLINVFTPIIKVINTVLGKLSALASAFSKFTEGIFGKQDTSGTTGQLNDVADAAGKAAGGVSGIGEAAKKSANEAKRAIASFDKINKLSDSSSSSDSSGKKSGATGGIAGNQVQGGEKIKQTSTILESLKNSLSKLQKQFAKGFILGSGNLKPAISDCKKHLKGIGNSLQDIFTDKNVKKAFSNMVSLFALNAGKIAGALASVGVTLADCIIGGIDLFLKQNKERIKQWLIDIFNIKGETAKIAGDFAVSCAEIFSVFRSAPAKQIVADIIACFTSAFGNVIVLSSKLGRDIISAVTKPITENADRIKTALANTLSPIQRNVATIKDLINSAFENIQRLYDNHIAPFFQSIKNGLSSVVKTITDSYNGYIVPVLNAWSEKFSELKEKLSPAFAKITYLFGKIVDVIKGLWENVLVPFINFIVANVVPVIAPVLQALGTVFMDVFGAIGDIIGGIASVLGGIIDFICGVFSADWKQAWGGVLNILSGIWSVITGVFGGAWNVIKDTFSGVGGFFSNIWKKIKDCFSVAKSYFNCTFTIAWNAVKSAFSGVKLFFNGVWNGIKSCFGSVTSWFKNTFTAAWTAVKNVFSTGGKIFSGIKDGIASVFKTVVNGIIGGINTVIAVPFKTINGLLNKIHNVSIVGVKPFSKFWKENPLTVPQIPKLASGGYVKKNTPQLAMIGDNRHQGEVVAPEDKLAELARKGAEMASGNVGISNVIELLKQIIKLIEALDLDVYLDGEPIKKNVVRRINKDTKRTGKCEII